MKIETIDEDGQRPTALRIVFGTLGALAALLVVLAIVRPAMTMKAMHDVMATLGMSG